MIGVHKRDRANETERTLGHAMSTSTSPLLAPPLSAKLWGTTEEVQFERVADVLDWARHQREAWVASEPPSHHLSQVWKGQQSCINSLEQTAIQLERLLQKSDEDRSDQERAEIQQSASALRKRLSQFGTGDAISTSHPHFATIQALAETDPNAGAALLTACLATGNNVLQQSGQFDAIARIGATPFHDDARKKVLKTLKSELTTLKKNAETDLSALRTAMDEHANAAQTNVQDHEEAVREREKEWSGLVEKWGNEWLELKRVYDEKLALLAPTEYWRTRATNHREKAKHYAIAFGVTLTVFLALFAFLAIGYLLKPAEGSVLLVVLPVLIPAFAGVWVLRILGRLLSENLAISQDASERETMVKTFLSLMRDETTGKTVITDDDRRLILHALFRQSAVTSADDTPPIHWLQSFKTK